MLHPIVVSLCMPLKAEVDNLHADMLWHHIAVTWTADSNYLADGSRQAAGSVKLYVDCSMLLDSTDPRGSQSTAFG
jgi:hypothetical protein